MLLVTLGYKKTMSLSYMTSQSGVVVSSPHLQPIQSTGFITVTAADNTVTLSGGSGSGREEGRKVSHIQPASEQEVKNKQNE